ncbi:Protein of unknown function [Actinacidiphila yanglinensis]|uniref:DUF3152 domain-containing protein n=1 Tax=Actinacidiphila yanglinensis TaxID=310779 RepID=A0A1H5V8H1_9ACTN|nr:DUF3152 domain-containing protein [Actinacidiphila yanglinensis]SEF83692.1 Protein of unknown function [Actinacidiphila yanglinensis]
MEYGHGSEYRRGDRELIEGVGKHSATDGQDDRDNRDRRTPEPGGFPSGGPVPPGAPGTGRRRRGPAEDSDYFAPLRPSDRDDPPRPHHPDDPSRPHDPDDPPGRHPEHREHGAWGAGGTWPAARSARRDLPFDPEDWAADWAPYDTASAMSSPAAHGVQPRHGQAGRVMPRPRQEFLDAFDAPPPPRPVAHPPPGNAEPDDDGAGGAPGTPADDAPASGTPGGSGRGRARALTGVAAAAALAALAVLGGTQFHRGHHRPDDDGTPAPGSGPSAGETPSAPTTAPASASTATPASYDEQMARQYPLDPDLSLSGAFTTVPGHQAAPGKGKVLRFRVDVEQGLRLDPRLFSDTVFSTLNDPRSWGHGGSMTFERVSTGPADIVVTLASPGTTAKWCAKSGLDTTVDNVSCDAASTPRTMINAYRWAQGAATYGPTRMHAYRQMLINHEVGHRLGHNHVGCPRQGALAPVMMQQTKYLSLDGGPTCRPNPWPFP